MLARLSQLAPLVAQPPAAFSAPRFSPVLLQAQFSDDDAAKRAWLARQEAPSWGPNKAAVSSWYDLGTRLTPEATETVTKPVADPAPELAPTKRPISQPAPIDKPMPTYAEYMAARLAAEQASNPADSPPAEEVERFEPSELSELTAEPVYMDMEPSAAEEPDEEPAITKELLVHMEAALELSDDLEPHYREDPDGCMVMQDLTDKHLPSAPTADLTAADVVTSLVRGLQVSPVSGAMRLHDFATFECRASLTKRCGSAGPEDFVREAMLWELPGCEMFRICHSSGLIPATETRGAMTTVTVEVPVKIGFRHKSGFERQAEPEPEAEADAKVETKPKSRTPEPISMSEDDLSPKQAMERYQFTMCQERRPPHTGCWLVKRIVPVNQYNLFAGGDD